MRDLEEILNINAEPFDDEVLDNIYYAGYAGQSTNMLDSMAVLIFQYYRKFDDWYGTSLFEESTIEQIFPEAMYDNEAFIWRENIGGVIYEALKETGWNMHWIGSYIEELRDALAEYAESEEDFHKAFENFLDSMYEDGFIKSCLQKEESEIRESSSYLEESEMCLLWNDNFDRYSEYKKKNKNLVYAICPKEEQGISALQEEVWKPYVMWYTQKTGVCQKKKYSLIILGTDGYNFCDSSDINPNWIFKIIKLGWLLESAFEKIDCYEKEKQRRKVA